MIIISLYKVRSNLIPNRISQQSYRRANEMRQFQRETIMTPGGFKTVRIYATADENQNLMNKV